MKVFGGHGCKLWAGMLTVSLCLVIAQHVTFFPGAMADGGGNGTRDVSEITWVLTSDVDFGSGSLDRLRIFGSGAGASLKLGFNQTGEWIQKSPALSPAPRRGHALATVHGDDKVLMFGGFDDTNYLNDTWVYDLSDDSWTAMFPSGDTPPGRHSHAMAGLPGTDEVLLFGGALASGYDNVTWVYDLSDNAWRFETAQDRPSARVYHAMVPVPQDDGVATDEMVVLFGGYGGAGYLDDTWVFNSSGDWAAKSPSLSPSPRKGAEMAPVHGTDRMVLFGGNESGLTELDDTWVYDVGDDAWIPAIPVGDMPTARRGQGMGQIIGTDEVLLFGPDNQTWVYGLGRNEWTRKLLPTGPSERYISHGVASVDGTDQLVLFGGGLLSSVWNNYNDTWVYDASSFVNFGSYVSSPYDTLSFPSYTGLGWVADTPPGTSVSFHVRTAGSLGDLEGMEFIGPDGTAATQYTVPGQPLCACHERDRFLQFRVTLSTSDEQHSPSLEEISVTHLPIDTDGDGFHDFDDEDDDGDGIPDSWEEQHGLDPLSAIDSTEDPDRDGLRNLKEFTAGSEPHDGDTDGDGLGDGFEALFSNTDPTDSDTDDDGVGDMLWFVQTSGYIGAVTGLDDGRIRITFAWEGHTMQVATDSEVLAGSYNKGGGILGITVHRAENTQGVTDIDLPSDMCAPERIAVTLDNVASSYTLTSGAAGCTIRVEYTHSVLEPTRHLNVFLGPVDGERDPGLSSSLFVVALLASLVVIAILAAVIARGKAGDEDRQLRELSPEQLSRLLEKRRSDGKISDDTYEDMKSILEEE